MIEVDKMCSLFVSGTAAKKSKTAFKQIPKFRVNISAVLANLPKVRLDIPYIATKAEACRDTMVYDSVIDEIDAAMVTDGKDVLIMTRANGYLRLSRDAIPDLILELLNVEKDMYRNIWDWEEEA